MSVKRHRRRACCAPRRSPGARAVVPHQPFQRLGHVAVAEVPGLRPAADHRPVEGLRVLEHQSVLLGGEPRLPVIGGMIADAPAQLAEQVDHLVLARIGHESRRPGVFLHVLAMGFEAAKRPPGGLERRRVGALEVGHDGVQRLP